MATAPSSPQLLKWVIGIRLRQARDAAPDRLSRSQVAANLGISRARVGHLETGRNLPDPATLQALLALYEAQDKLADLEHMVAAVHEGRNWWQHLSRAVPEWFNLFLGLESGAARLSIFDTYLVPGILQTPGYAEAVIRSDSDARDQMIRQRVELRTSRQHILVPGGDRDPAQLQAVIDESVLYRQRGDRAAMHEQIQHLLDISEYEHVDLRVLPFTAGTHVGQQSSFQMLELPGEFDAPKVAYVELLPEVRYYYDDPDEVEQNDVALYERAMTDLLTRAASREDSRRFLHAAQATLAG